MSKKLSMKGSLNDAAQDTGAYADSNDDASHLFVRDAEAAAKAKPEPLTHDPASVFATRKQMRTFER